MTNEYLTIAEIEKITGISNSNIRRYIANFDSFFIAKGGSRIKKYEMESVEILKRIKSLYDEGMDTQEIHNILVKEFPLVVNGEEQEKHGQAPTVPTLATHGDIVKIGEDVAELKEMYKQQQLFNELLLKKLNERDEYIKESLERRDRELMKSIRELQQRKIEAAAAQEKAVKSGEEVTNNEEEATVKNGEEVVKASKEVAAAQEEKKGFWAWLLGK